MKKDDFLSSLRYSLQNIPEEEIEKSAAYYSEMIDDRMEDGMQEEEAVASLGSIAEIVQQIQTELPIATLIKNKVNRRPMDALTVTLLILGFPLWFTLLAALLCVIFSIYLCIWAFDVALWSVVVALGASFLGGIGAAAVTAFNRMPADALVYLGYALAGAGLCVFAYFGVLETTKAVVRLSAWITKKIKIMIIGRKEAA